MPVPKRKTSRQRKNKRFANKGLTMIAVGSCLTCQKPLASHTVCQECGYYKGVKVLRTKTDRRHERGQVRQAKMAASQQGTPAPEQSEDEKPTA